MHFTQTTLATAVGLAGSGLALPTDSHDDDINISIGIDHGHHEEPSAVAVHTTEETYQITRTISTDIPTATQARLLSPGPSPRNGFPQLSSPGLPHTPHAPQH
ncbi:hypothetical protein PG994_014032 [Apiospora phragmitis]|uniref:Uncharacterized protein n=1 Tax=Apiospora phragmitis TaxID=2905665 RepID=A0ABR1T335_9PEZI